MATLTIRLPDDKKERLAQLAKSRGISINKLIEELSTIALAEFNAKKHGLWRSHPEAATKPVWNYWTSLMP